MCNASMNNIMRFDVELSSQREDNGIINTLPIYTESNFHCTSFSSKITVSSWVTRWIQEDKSNNTEMV